MFISGCAVQRLRAEESGPAAGRRGVDQGGEPGDLRSAEVKLGGVIIQDVPQLSSHFVLLVFSASMLIQRFLLPFFNSPGDDDFKTYLTFLPISKFDHITEQNVEQP